MFFFLFWNLKEQILRQNLSNIHISELVKYLQSIVWLLNFTFYINVNYNTELIFIPYLLIIHIDFKLSKLSVSKLIIFLQSKVKFSKVLIKKEPHKIIPSSIYRPMKRKFIYKKNNIYSIYI